MSISHSKSYFQPLKVSIIKFLVYGSMIYLTAEILKWSATEHPLGSKFSEQSLVEYLQSVLLLLSSAIYLWISFRYKSVFPLAFGLFAFHFASLIREQDAYLDEYIYDGAWQTFAFGILFLAIFLIYSKWRLFLTNIAGFVQSFSFGILLSGIMTTYIFARLYGRKVFWMAVMESQYTRDVKNVSEESLELYGYVLLVISGVEFFLLAKGSAKTLALKTPLDRPHLNASA
ncbi:hypothetical protein DU508_16460 [Pedobacter chinensis]|uniref:Uncharacterized protein n=1 Tax=Pedobacter chinensis TaxID=2282421 RepID=A0A369PT69_9SPHI|nr:hypothetical protein [Pedobacter chinensis]RDC55851.1 hypothetical protein DU508_16460 [Pedobacter chinensis]